MIYSRKEWMGSGCLKRDEEKKKKKSEIWEVFFDTFAEKYQGAVDLKLCQNFYDDSTPHAHFSFSKLYVE